MRAERIRSYRSKKLLRIARMLCYNERLCGSLRRTCLHAIRIGCTYDGKAQVGLGNVQDCFPLVVSSLPSYSERTTFLYSRQCGYTSHCRTAP